MFQNGGWGVPGSGHGVAPHQPLVRSGRATYSDHDLHRRPRHALLALHTDPTLLTLVNVWDVASARVVAQTDGTAAIATASHAIAAAYGYEDGEHIPRDLMLEAVGRIVGARRPAGDRRPRGGIRRRRRDRAAGRSGSGSSAATSRTS